MGDICLVCRKNPDEEFKEVSVVYEGFKFTSSKRYQRCKECAKKELLDRIKTLVGYSRTELAELIELEDDEIGVNWKYYLELEGSLSDFEMLIINQILELLGIFSLKEGWAIIGIKDSREYKLFSPMHTTEVYYFTRKEDALAFCRLKFSIDYYSSGYFFHGIRHIDVDEFIGYEEVLEEK